MSHKFTINEYFCIAVDTFEFHKAQFVFSFRQTETLGILHGLPLEEGAAATGCTVGASFCTQHGIMGYHNRPRSGIIGGRHRKIAVVLTDLPVLIKLNFQHYSSLLSLIFLRSAHGEPGQFFIDFLCGGLCCNRIRDLTDQCRIQNRPKRSESEGKVIFNQLAQYGNFTEQG